MGKGKERHNPDKPQNTVGDLCDHYDIHTNGFEFCHCPTPKIYWWTTTDGKLDCEGNPHNCLKVKRKFLASLSDNEREKIIAKYET